MKRIILIIFGVCLVILVSGAEAKYLSVGTFEAFIKEVPDVKSDDVAGIPPYYPLYVLGKSKDWYLVRDWMGSEGYILASLLTEDQTLIVNKINATLRSGAGVRYAKIGSLYRGYILKIIKKSGSWYQVKVVDPPEDEIEGWIHASLVWGD